MNIYVGNLSYNIKEDALRQAFEEYGEVSSAKIITDRESGRSKVFVFVVMTNDDEANTAIENLNGKELQGRTVNVSQARPRKESFSNQNR